MESIVWQLTSKVQGYTRFYFYFFAPTTWAININTISSHVLNRLQNCLITINYVVGMKCSLSFASHDPRCISTLALLNVEKSMWYLLCNFVFAIWTFYITCFLRGFPRYEVVGHLIWIHIKVTLFHWGVSLEDCLHLRLLNIWFTYTLELHSLIEVIEHLILKTLHVHFLFEVQARFLPCFVFVFCIIRGGKNNK
jgi:hypothetical protein